MKEQVLLIAAIIILLAGSSFNNKKNDPITIAIAYVCGQIEGLQYATGHINISKECAETRAIAVAAGAQP